MHIKEKPNKLYPDGPDWQWEPNLKHWFHTTEDGLKAMVWVDWTNAPDDKGIQKLSKSSDKGRKLSWDGICTGVPGGPEPSERQGPILSWLRQGIAEKRLSILFTPEQREALRHLKGLGRSLANGSSWDIRLASVMKKDPVTKEEVLSENITLDTGALRALASMPTGR